MHIFSKRHQLYTERKWFLCNNLACHDNAVLNVKFSPGHSPANIVTSCSVTYMPQKDTEKQIMKERNS